MSVRPSVCPSIRPPVSRLVRRSVTHELKPRKSAIFVRIYYQYERERILWPCIRPCFFCIVDFLSTIIFRQIIFSKSFIPSPIFSVDFLSVRFFPGSIFLSMSIFLFLNRVIHATFRLSLDFKSAGKNIHDLSITSLASFTPLVVPY